MEQKHLHELLREDQEPFQLKNFIADRRRRLKSTPTAGSGAGAGAVSLQSRKRKPIIESTSSSAARNFCINHVCLFSLQDSPDFRKSPFLDFPAKSPCNNNNKSPQNAAVLLHIPARTAAVLLDAATRVKTGSSKNIGFGLFGSFLKRLKDRSIRTKSREIRPGPGNVTASSPPTRRSRNNSRRSSADWSEKSSELETSCSSRSIHDSERDDDVLDSCEKCFCSSPASPFRFSLQTSPSPGRWKPDSISPVASPSRHFLQDEKGCDDEISEEINGEEEEEKEHSSPVSILDLPFDDDDEEHDGGAVEEDDYDIECSYASVQRAKHQLLQKLQRFERLAGLDPIELEKHMFEQSDNEDDNNQEEATNKDFVSEIINHLGVAKIPWYMKKLVSDLVAEETKNEEQKVVKNVCKKLHSWKVVELNTIDMMVEMDFQSEGWKNSDSEIRETGMDIEIAIFGFLMEELAQEMGD